MNDLSNSSPTSSPPSEPKRHSRLGIASLILALISVFLGCSFIVFNYWVNSISAITTQAPAMANYVFLGVIPLSALAGFGFGIVGLIKPARSKVYGILGIVISSLILLGFCLLTALVIGLFSQGFLSRN